MSERQAKAPTMRALLPSRLVPEDMLSEWQGPNLPNTKNYAPPPDSMRGRMGDVLMQGIAALGGFTGLPMGGEESKAALLGELLAAGMPLVGGVKQLAKLVGAENKVAQGIKAYHGSPHDFDQFSLSKIGTGEGNQSYLRGLYFAEDPTVARTYRDKVPGMQGKTQMVDGRPINWDDPVETAAFEASRHGGDREAAAQFFEKTFKKDSPVPSILRSGAPLPKVESPGKLYEVSINADPEDFLDWDAPLSQQSEKVQQKLPTYLQPQEGENMGDALRRIRMDEDPEEGLRAAGIQGIKYFDEGSRGPSFRVGLLKNRIAREKAQGLPFDHWQQELDALEKTPSTRNYVVFDDTKISIVKKFGIAAALSAGAINELEARQLQAQGYQ